MLAPPAAPLELRERRPELGHAVDEDRSVSLEVVGQQDQGRTSVNRTAATRVPIESIANTTRPPRTSLKNARSSATSRLGTYRKSSCSKERGARVGHYAAMAASAFGTVSSGVTGDQACSIRPSSSTRKEERRIPKYVWPPRCFSAHVPHADATA